MMIFNERGDILKYKGRIGFITDNKLFGSGSNVDGHYVYIREYNSNTGKCVVNTITSLEDINGNYKSKRIKELRKGNIYSIPKKDSNLTLWSGISCNPIRNVNLNDISFTVKKKIKKRHRFFINKFLGVRRY